jgi:Protein of unknown function (DUF4038)/Putative collagen-binding domain of a collagenase
VETTISAVQKSGDMTMYDYPLKVSPNHRFLVDQKNEPFLLQGDAPWSLIVGVSREDAEMYLADRSKRRFNTLLVNLIEHKFCRDPPKNFYGEAPFETPGDFSTPNEKYFEHVDWVIRKAAEYGIQILLCPIFLGVPSWDGTEGWYNELVAQKKPLSCLEYGAYLGKRYANFDNIIWSLGADRNPAGDALERMNLIALGIKEHDHRHLMTAQCYPESSSADIYSSGGWLDVNATYSYGIVHRKLLADYNHSPTMPVFLIESTYEGEHNSSQAQIRRQAYWSVLCGGFGHIFGNFSIWPLGVQFGNNAAWPPSTEGWKSQLDKPGSVGMTHFGDFFRELPWYELIPDQKHIFVTGGLGEIRGLDYLTAGVTADSKVLVAYMPTERTITVDLSKLAGGSKNPSWFDPTNGKFIEIGKFEATNGPTEFTPPAPGDWAIVFR